MQRNTKEQSKGREPRAGKCRESKVEDPKLKHQTPKLNQAMHTNGHGDAAWNWQDKGYHEGLARATLSASLCDVLPSPSALYRQKEATAFRVGGMFVR
jgi:hypothetical protein